MQIAFAIAMAPQLGALAVSTVWSYLRDMQDTLDPPQDTMEDQSLTTPETEKVQIEEEGSSVQPAEVVLGEDNGQVEEEKSGPVCSEEGAESSEFCETSRRDPQKRPTEEECITSCLEVQDSLSAQKGAGFCGLDDERNDGYRIEMLTEDDVEARESCCEETTDDVSAEEDSSCREEDREEEECQMSEERMGQEEQFLTPREVSGHSREGSQSEGTDSEYHTDNGDSFPLTENEIRQLAEENARYFADCHTNQHRPTRPLTPEIKPGVEPVYHAAFCSIIVDSTHNLFIEAATHYGLLGNNINSNMNNKNCRHRAEIPSWLLSGEAGRQQTTLHTIVPMVAEKVVTMVTSGDQEEIEDGADLLMILHYKTELAVKNVYNKRY